MMSQPWKVKVKDDFRCFLATYFVFILRFYKTKNVVKVVTWHSIFPASKIESSSFANCFWNFSLERIVEDFRF